MRWARTSAPPILIVRAVDPVVGDPLEEGERAGTRDLDLPERGHVDDADALAEGLVLGRDALEEGRDRPAERALVCPGASPRRARLEVLRALPAVLRPEDGAELLQTPVQRAQALRPAPLVRVERIPEAVVVLVDLARGRFREVGITVGSPEAPRPVPRNVELRLPCRDQLRKRLAHPARAAEAVQRQARRHPDTRDARQR